MRRVQTIVDMKAEARAQSSAGRTIGLVPTMGALHEGHLSLVRECRRSVAVTVVSIFVNPLQFGPGEDFRVYPRNVEQDAALLEKEGVDVLFLPGAAEMYPAGFQTTVEVERLQEHLCGASRPGHFKGVATVVLKLLNIVRPGIAFFGQKDAQQAVVVQRMVADLNLDVTIRVMPTVRESDGLAMSSRNAYLSVAERQAAAVLSRSLAEARRAFEGGERRAAAVTARVRDIIAAEPQARIDYVEVVGWPDLGRVDIIDRDALVALAVTIGRTRLIDNTILERKE
jgi:pantoate--beta-alanine ligase